MLSLALGSGVSHAGAAEAAPDAPATYIVTPTPEADLAALAEVLEWHGDEVVGLLTEVGRIVVETERSASDIEASAGVETVRPSVGLKASLSESGGVVGADVAAGLGFTGNGKVVVVLDSGVDTTHPALADAVVHEACFLQGTGGICPGSGSATSVGPGSATPCGFSDVTCAHGTHVAGIIASRDATRPGIASGSGVVAIRVVAENGAIESAAVLAALDHVAVLAASFDIVAVNLSFGSNGDTCIDPDLDAAVAVLATLDIVVVAASGNGPVDEIEYPACLDGIVAVGSAEADGDDRVVSDFTQFDGDLQLVAPGRSIESTVTVAQDPSGFDRYTGTSMAAPHVAGALAVLAEAHEELSTHRLLALLRSTGAPVSLVDDEVLVGVYPEPRLAEAIEFVPFSDAPPGFSQAAIDWAAATGVSEGVGGGEFGPSRWATRAEVAALLWRLFGSPEPAGAPPFDDVDPDAYYADAVAWLFENGITTGTSPSTFSPSALANRAQIATLFWRAAGSPLGPPPGFVDVEADRYFTEAVGWMLRWKITTGTSATTFSPYAVTTREHAITFLWRLANTRDAWGDAVDVPLGVLS